MRKLAPSEQDDQEAVLELERSWDDLFPPVAEAEAKLNQLVAEWGDRKASDPIVIDVDLLSPLGQERRETAHTRVLRYLLDPSESHGLGDGPLDRFLLVVENCMPEAQGDELHATVPDLTGAEVIAERAALIRVPDTDERAGRSDLWVEAPKGAPRLIVLIENKLDDEVRPAQLGLYEQFLAQRVSSLAVPPTVVKVLLTLASPEVLGDNTSGGWVRVSLLDVAYYWLELLDEESSASGREYLRLYLATVFQRLMGIRWSETRSRGQTALLTEYLQMRLGRNEQP